MSQWWEQHLSIDLWCGWQNDPLSLLFPAPVFFFFSHLPVWSSQCSTRQSQLLFQTGPVWQDRWDFSDALLGGVGGDGSCGASDGQIRGQTGKSVWGLTNPEGRFGSYEEILDLLISSNEHGDQTSLYVCVCGCVWLCVYIEATGKSNHVASVAVLFL